MALKIADEPVTGDVGVHSQHAAVLHAVKHAAHLLPSQGPITVFVHHNTLHAFEDLDFEKGVEAGGRLYACHAYLTEEKYRQMLSRGRIRVADLEAVLIDDLADEAALFVALFGTRYALRLAMMQFPFLTGPDEELRWMIAETDALRRFRPEVEPSIRDQMINETRKWVLRDLQENTTARKPAIDVVGDVWEQFDRRSIESWSDQAWETLVLNFLWRVCERGVRLAYEQLPLREAQQESRRHRDALMRVTGEDADILVHDVLIPFCAAYVDQGFADWELPDRHDGFYASFLQLYGNSFASPTRWMGKLHGEARRLLDSGQGPLESIEESLGLLGVNQTERDEFIAQSLLALRGWAGMIWQLETEAEWAPWPVPEGCLIEYLAIRLILDRLAVAQVAQEAIGFNGPLSDLRAEAARHARMQASNPSDGRVFPVFHLAQVRGWKPEDLQHLSQEHWVTLVREINEFSALERRRVFHLAFERKYRNEILDAVIAHAKSRRADPVGDPKPTRKSTVPDYQIVCCIDDREESFRRHLEECDPRCETFGVAGFFGTAMYYKGVADAHFKPLCPVAVKPLHYVVEEPLFSMQADADFRAGARRRLGHATHQAHYRSRTFLGGVITTLAGSLAAFPLVARILFPRLTARIRRWAGGMVRPPMTQLRLERLDPEPGQSNGQLGYSIDEMANIVEGVLLAIGLKGRWSRLVAFLGHGSSSLNNPHESAYNCGACSGSRGGPNARAFAQMANDFRVRTRLAQRGLTIPEDTVFVGGYHDTATDSVTFADLDRLPVSHRNDFLRLSATIAEVRARNAHERCRRFVSARLDLSPLDALRHVEGRAEDLSQARPEYNHATNALCLVGRREWSRGLFLDRRAFMSSYDPSQDDIRGTILEGILRPVIPVCAGISLEYYFSTVDVEGYGCGSKLPHNITSLVGVMSGAASDLKPGLSAQMTEIHEALRILFLVETTPEVIARIIRENEQISRLVDGNWVQLAVFDADTSTIHRYVDGEFVKHEPESHELPQVASSFDWYRGRRDNLGVAEISSS
ncbi:MAG: DUF2309 domain-containing protein [Planctomycetaceae bacterium]|nr:DUF2309 domain-containing protein [Planctomycetaceae bacterium]